MLDTYQWPIFDYVQSQEQKSGTPWCHKVVIVGAGPIGLTAALDLASRGIAVLVIDDNNTVSVGSRAVCYAKRPLEIWDRLGVADRMIETGVVWNRGRVFFRDQEVYDFARAVIGNFQPDFFPKLSRGQFTLKRPHQIIYFFFMHEKVGISCDTKLITAGHIHAREEVGCMLVNNGCQEHEIVFMRGARCW